MDKINQAQDNINEMKFDELSIQSQNIYLNPVNGVGIGNPSPSSSLTVEGDISQSGNFITNGNITASGAISSSGLTITDDIPIITSVPINEAFEDIQYIYQINIDDPDDNTFEYVLINGINDSEENIVISFGIKNKLYSKDFNNDLETL